MPSNRKQTSTRMIQTARKGALIAVSVALLSTQAHARAAQVCLELPAGASTVKAQISSGCLSSSPGYEAAFSVSVDAAEAVIAIDGDFKAKREMRVVTADCMGARTIEKEAEAAGPRRYSVMVNGQYRGVLDASDTQFGMRAVKECFEGRGQIQRPRPERVTTYRPGMFNDWIGRKKGQPSNPVHQQGYKTLGFLAAALLGNHPENKEGRPSAQIKISKAAWQFGGFPKPPIPYFMAIEVEEHGYLDDSVSGKRTFAEIRQDPETGEWRIAGHWYQLMCARGEHAGQWSAQPCL